MESKDELKETDIKNCMYYCCNAKLRVKDINIDFSDILVEEKLDIKNTKMF